MDVQELTPVFEETIYASYIKATVNSFVVLSPDVLLFEYFLFLAAYIMYANKFVIFYL